MSLQEIGREVSLMPATGRARATRFTAILMIAILLGCATEAPVEMDEPAPAPATPAPAPPALIDAAIAPAIAGEDGWNFQQRVTGDLTGDGRPERVVLTARVELVRGQPAWDDGQPWQVYIESGDGDRTYLYAQRLQLGTLSMRLSQPDATRLPTLILLEQLPEQWRIIEVDYPTAGGSPRVAVPFERRIDARGDIVEH